MLHLGIEIPTRDGIVLRGLHHQPARGPAPTILIRTPYGADRLHSDGSFFASRGFNFVSLDTRGRGDSGGTFQPFVDDAADGHDVINWLAEQPWSNGDVVTYGGSYCGFNQWAVAATQPPALRAIAPVASVYPGVDFPMARGLPLREVVMWLTLIDGRRLNNGPYDDESLWRNASRDLIEHDRPFRDLDLVALGRRLPTFQHWLDHPDFDEYWAGLVPTTEQLATITMPVLTITGQYDDDQVGALRHHDAHLAAVDSGTVGSGATQRHQVLIGPWNHGGTRTGKRSFGGLTFAPASELDLRALHADWYDWVLGRGPRPELLADRVTYFHVGEDRWRTAENIPDGGKSLLLYPHGEQALTLDPPSATQVLELAVDPGKAVDEGRDGRSEGDDFVVSQTELAPRTGSLGHCTAPLTTPLDISGRIRAHLLVAAELPDFDLLLSVYLLRGADSATLLTEVPFRARYRDSHAAPTAWPVDTEVPVEITDFPFVSLRTAPGDRLALVIRPPDLRFQPNFQAGTLAADERPEQAVPGIIRIVQDPSRPSYLALPLSNDTADGTAAAAAAVTG